MKHAKEDSETYGKRKCAQNHEGACLMSDKDKKKRKEKTNKSKLTQKEKKEKRKKKKEKGGTVSTLAS